MSETPETPERTPAPDAAPADPNPAAESATAVTPGAAIEESEPTTTEVFAAVDRSAALPSDGAIAAEAGAPSPAERSVDATEPAVAPGAPAQSAPTTVMPDAAPTTPRPEIVPPEEMPSAGAAVVPAAPTIPDNKVLISADHPMAALYMQTPMPPDLKGNRGAGVLIALLSTVVFAALFGGVMYLWTGAGASFELLMQLALWPLVGATTAFFLGFALLVLIVGRAGWWAYVLGGFLVGVLVWAATVAAGAYSIYLLGGSSALSDDVLGGSGLSAFALISGLGLTLPPVAAGLIAREVIVWFGAWIGARGRRVTRANAAAVAEYNAAVAEAQATQP